MQQKTPNKQKKPEKSANKFPVVGVGASAGGLAAFKKFLGAIPEDSGMAYVLVQHLDPKHDSLLPELLQRATRVPVLEISDDIKVEPDHIYIIPSNKMLLATDGVLKLSPRPAPKSNTRNLPINLFFSSLAAVHGPHSLGVVLTGTGSDGTEGLRAIKDEGGVTFAQDEESAEWPEMPRNAADAGVVDFVLSAGEIPRKILEIINTLDQDGKGEEAVSRSDEEVFRQVIALLRIRKGTDFTYYRQTTIHRRILRRMALNKNKRPDDYLTYLREDGKEQDLLYQDLLIPVTTFFRDPDIFDNVCESILPLIVQNKREGSPIRLWAAGCSTGQEAYSMAICLREHLNAHPGPDKAAGTTFQEKVQIFASDISEPAIAKARKGIYTKQEVEGVSPGRLKEFFAKSNGGYQLNKEVRELCVFAVHDFLKDPPFGNMDLISCRNVLIYLQPYLQKKALTTFHYALNAKGYLLLGRSETSGSMPDHFTAVRKKDRLFMRNDAPGRFMPSSSAQDERALRNRDRGGTAIEKRRTDFQRTADELLLGSYTPASVVVNESLDIVLFRGNTDDYLGHQSGVPSNNLVQMAKGGLAFELRSLLHRAKKGEAPASKEQVPFHVNGTRALITIEAVPLPNMEEPHYLVLFHPPGPPAENGPTKEGKGHKKDEKDLLIAQLERELVQGREDMRAITQDQEAANEELQSANEELLSGGEELQSLNEELETSKEELQSSNEEITVVNQELTGLNEQVTQERNFAQGIIKTVREPLVVLDKDLKVITANSSFYRTFQVKEAETEGASIYGLGNKQWDIPKLRGLLEELLPEKKSLVDFEMTHTFESIGERSMLLNAREIKGENGAKKMILLAIEDITGRRQAEKKVEESVHRYHEMIHSSPSLIAILEGEDLVITEANDAILKSWGKDKNAIGRPLMQALPELEGLGFDLLLIDVLKTGKAYRAHETQVEIVRDGRPETVYYNFVYQAQRDSNGKIIGVAIIATEVTAQAELNKKIRESEARYHQMTDLVPDMISNADAQGKVFYYNRAWTDFSGWDMDTIKERGWGKLMHPEELHTVEKNWKRAVRTGNDFEMELRILDRNGDYKWHISRAVPVRDESGKIIMWIGTNTEIHKLKEEEKRKEGFLKMVSHELKTPITSIKGYTQMLLSMMEGDKEIQWGSMPIKPSLQRIDNQISRLTRLISEMLDLTRIEDSQLLLEKETFDLNKLVGETIKDLEYAHELANITLQQEAHCQVSADRDRIGQVLINFVTNAIKYSPNNRDIEIKILQPSRDSVSVSVRDHGIGIEKNDQPHLFKRFYRVSGKNEETYSGFGIGLYLAREIMVRHDGHIRVNSKKGEGSEFTFTLPVHTAADMERGNEDE